MRAHIPATIVSLSIIFLSSCSPKSSFIPTSSETAISIDGNTGEWNELLQDSKSSILYSLRQDSNSLYLHFKITGKEDQEKVIQKGLTLWFDHRNGKTKTKGIHYPKESDYEQLKTYMFDETISFYETFNSQYSSGLHFIELVSSPTDGEPQIAYSKSDKGINVALRFDTLQYLNYEAQIPLSFIGSTAKKELFSIGFETGKFDFEEKSEEFDLSQSSSQYEHSQDPRQINQFTPVDYSGQTSNPNYSTRNQPTRFWIKSIDLR